MVDVRYHSKPFKPYDTGWETLADIILVSIIFLRYANLFQYFSRYFVNNIILIINTFGADSSTLGEKFLDDTFYILDSGTKQVCDFSVEARWYPITSSDDEFKLVHIYNWKSRQRNNRGFPKFNKELNNCAQHRLQGVRKYKKRREYHIVILTKMVRWKGNIYFVTDYFQDHQQQFRWKPNNYGSRTNNHFKHNSCKNQKDRKQHKKEVLKDQRVWFPEWI